MTAPIAARAARGFLIFVLAGVVFQRLNVTVKTLVHEVWQEPGAAHWLLAFLGGFFGTLGYFLMTWAFRLLDISAVQPLAFLGIVWASLFDLVVFGRTADAWTYVGAAIVVAASSVIVHREASRRIG